MPASAAKLRSIRKWDDKAYDKILLRVPKGKKDLIQAYTQKQGLSLNGFISRAIDEAMQREEEKNV